LLVGSFDQPTMITLFGIFFGLALGALAAWSIRRSRQSRRASRDWLTTDGRIVESRVEQKNLGSGDRPGILFAPRVTYEYSVNDHTYRSERIAFSGGVSSLAPQAAQVKIARYPSGAQVTVYYNPKRPEEAVLERDG